MHPQRTKHAKLHSTKLQPRIATVLYTICTIFTWGALCSPGNAKLQEQLRYTYYPFAAPTTPTTPETFTTQNNSSIYHAARTASNNAPRKDGSIPVAQAQWEMQLDYSMTQTARKCSIKNHVVKLDVTITLPQMQGGTPEQKDQFEKMFTILKSHEQQHYYITRQQMRIFDKMVESIPAATTCEKLQENINQLQTRYVELTDQQNEQFDITEGYREELYFP